MPIQTGLKGEDLTTITANAKLKYALDYFGLANLEEAVSLGPWETLTRLKGKAFFNLTAYSILRKGLDNEFNPVDRGDWPSADQAEQLLGYFLNGDAQSLLGLEVDSPVREEVIEELLYNGIRTLHQLSQVTTEYLFNLVLHIALNQKSDIDLAVSQTHQVVSAFINYAQRYIKQYNDLEPFIPPSIQTLIKSQGHFELPEDE